MLFRSLLGAVAHGLFTAVGAGGEQAVEHLEGAAHAWRDQDVGDAVGEYADLRRELVEEAGALGEGVVGLLGRRGVWDARLSQRARQEPSARRL